jgi:hypothetical protein
MKTRMSLQRTPNSKFTDVARIIAKGNPPKWLVLGLEHFSGGIGVDISKKDRRFFDKQIERMQGAVHTLMTWLPMWENLGYGVRCPEHVALMLYALPRVRKDLDRLAKKQIGRRPDAQREVCAAVVIETWKLLHGRVKPRSDEFLGACRDYWRACGGKQGGPDDPNDPNDPDNPDNWRRTVKRALATDHSWIGRVLLAVQNER